MMGGSLGSSLSVLGSEVFVIKVNKFVYEETAKKKKSQYADEVSDKEKEDEKVDLFYKEDRLYKVLRNIRDGSVVCSFQLFVRLGKLCRHIFWRFKGHGEGDVVQESVNVQEGGVVAQESVDVHKEEIVGQESIDVQDEGGVAPKSVDVQEE
uniref:FAR1 DNA binding domain, zinc finger, SWIM-type, MULE transposase domain, FHY3/FAR1 family n=1 Tax=Tanacetum cinerariifolium TaxID=118510 RepID=A0A699IQR8_TANCI|nr:FAR1 DNA binding domain, zinc finger, SWIM-type, MULE transposase domain, FHY3/FAR1 family [Tanacetum cinerariifolium]